MFQNLAQFKKTIKIGTKINCVYHMEFAGRDDNGKPIWTDKVLPTREVSIVQTNSFAMRTQKTDGTVHDSWCDFPKASECKIEDGKLIILERDTRQFKGGLADESNPDYKSLPLIPVLTYSFVD